MAPSAPGVNGHAQAAFDWAGRFIAAQVRLLLVANQVGGNVQLLRIDLRPIRELDVFEEELQRIHFQRRCRVFHGRHGQKTGLRMAWRPPGLLAAAICADGFANRADVWNFGEDIRQIRSAETTYAASAPDLRIHRCHRPVLHRTDFNFRVGRGTIAGVRQLDIAFEHQFDGPARHFSHHGADQAPSAGIEL